MSFSTVYSLLLALLDLLRAVMPRGKVQVKFKSITNHAVEVRSVQPLQKPLQSKTQKLFRGLKY